MNRQVEYVRIIKGQILDAIAMVNIPVKNENPLSTSGVQSMFGSHSDIVEITESLNMYTRRKLRLE